MYRLKRYYKWEKFIPINYLNDTQYINDELETLDIYVIEIQKMILDYYIKIIA